ncbi:MAG: hypothetical protein ACK5W9_09765 [Bdellovibrionales bacterium]
MSISLADTGRVVLEPIYDEWEGLPLVEKLLDDGLLEFAFEILKTQKESSKKYKLWARYLNESGQPQKVSQLIDEGFELARSFYLMKNWEKCSQARVNTDDLLPAFAMKILIECHLKSSKLETAWKLMNSTQDSQILDLKFKMLVQNQLFGEALKFLTELPQDSVNLETQMEWVQQLPDFEKAQAVDFLIIKFPSHIKPWLAWSEYQLKSGNLQSALRGFRQLAGLSSDFYSLAGEALRSEGFLEEAYYYSLLIPKAPEGLKLKMNLALDRADWLQLVGLTGAFERSKISNEDNLIYALAYSHLNLGDQPTAIRLSNKLKDTHLRLKFEQLVKIAR